MVLAESLKKGGDRKNESSFVEMLIFLLLSSLFFFLYCNYQFLDLYGLLNFNADVLFIEDVARDLNNGGRLFDWRLTQAPYLFPDIFFARMIAPFTALGQVAPIYHILLGGGLLGLYYVICRLAKTKLLLPLLFSATIYSLAFFGGPLPIYFGLIGNHSGVAIPVLIVLIATLLFIKDEKNFILSNVLSFLAIFLGTISDTLVVISCLPLIFMFFLLLAIAKEAKLSACLGFFIVSIFAGLLGKAFGYTNPFPQDRDYLQLLLNNFPHWMIPAIKAFIGDFITYCRTDKIFMSLMAMFFMSFLASSYHMSFVLRGKKSAKSPLTLFSLFIIFIPLLVIMMQLVFGIYSNISHSRQWAPVLYVGIILGALVFIETFPKAIAVFRLALVVYLVFLISFFVRKELGHVGTVTQKHEWQVLAECMKSNHLPKGHLYIADYWVSRPLEFMSNQDFKVSSFTATDGGKDFIPFSIAANVKQRRSAMPRYVVLGKGIKYQDIINRFGQPDKEYCKSGDLGVLDYSQNNVFLSRIKYLSLITH